MALEDTFDHEGLEITYVVHENGREAVARFVLGDSPHQVLLRRGHRGGGSTTGVPKEAAAAIAALGVHIWPLPASSSAGSKPQRGW
jgi:hypothetical protein